MRISVIACQVMIDELRSFLPANAPVEVFEISKHTRPKLLKQEIQAAIDRVDGHCDAILLGYGLCSNSVVGLSARKSILVMPKMHDCVGVFLGSHDAYLEVMASEPAFFLSQGYIRGYKSDKNGPFEFDRIAKKLGSERAEKIVGELMKPYKRLIYISTGHETDPEGDHQYAKEMAVRFKMRYEEKSGTPELLRRMAQGDWEEDFVVVYPGKEVRLEQFMDNPGHVNP